MARKKIKGIFEPFAEYVQKQLHVRKAIMSNPRTVEKDEIYNKWNISEDFSLEGRSTPNTLENEQNAVYGPENFHAYTTEKQAIIRMMSGVDLLDNIDPGLLEVGLDDNGNIREYISQRDSRNDEQYLNHATGLAKQYILEGGTRYYNDQGGNQGTREGFTSGKFTEDTHKGFSYGDRDVRANAADDFGIVPMPGIVDATIRTKSDNGSLREAEVNFICYNRRQLEILELLYMRPGYPVCLEWGWNPYISNEFERTNNDYSIKDDFFIQHASADDLNSKIREYKLASGGNYDGFIGYIKNFSFKAREDGGYDCTTEIMAHGEILESLKSTKMSVSTGEKLPDEESPEVESIDRLLYYLRAIKATLNNDGDAWYYKAKGTYYDVFNDGYNPEGATEGTSSEDFNLFSGTSTATYCQTSRGNCKLERESTTPGQGDAYMGNHYFTVNCSYTGIAVHKCDERSYSFEVQTKNGQPLTFDYDPSLFDGTDYKKTDAELIEEELNNAGYTSNQEYVEALNKQNAHYKGGYMDIIQLYANIVKAETVIGAEDSQPLMGQGYLSLLGGTILKQVVKYNPSYNAEGDYIDSGYRKNIYIRWDLLSQMINHLSTYKKMSGNFLRHPITEISYLHNNERTFENTEISKGKIKPGQSIYNENNVYDGTYSYIKYEPPVMLETDPPLKLYGDRGGIEAGSIEDPNGLNLNLGTIDPDIDGISIHPILGSSYDERICLLPHMSIFHNLYKTPQIPGNEVEGGVATQTQVDPDFSDNNDERSAGIGGEFKFLTTYQMAPETADSFDKALNAMSKIGLIHFNLDFVLDIYESLRLKKKVTENSTLTLLNDKFNMLDFIKGLWDGVNGATADFYKFTLTTEHERPHVARIVDMRFNRNNDDGIFTFEPQGLKSVTRQFFFNSKISNDMASMISIAAQAPNNVQSLESLSFKAFHKNIRSRFTSKEMSEAEKTANEKQAASQLEDDIKEYQELCASLSFYLLKLNQGNFETSEADKILLINPSEAAQTAQSIMDLRHSILNRYPLEDENGNPNNGENYDTNNDGTLDGTRPIAGFWRKGTTFDNSAIIPLQFNLEMDGLAGMIPLQVFKVDPDKLPFGYQRKDIVFIIKSEEHKITSGQDWTVQIVGQMALLNLNPNNKGKQGGNHTYIDLPNLDPIVPALELSYEGELFITEFEAPDGPVVTPYADGFDDNGNQKYAVGYGTQTWNGQKVTATYPPASEVTEEAARAEMIKHLEKSVYPYIKNHVTVDLSQPQFDAIVSYTYNVGAGNSVAGSTQFIAKLNAGNYLGASKEMDIISMGQGNNTWKVLKGLMTRRAKEQRLFNGHSKGYTTNDGDWSTCEGCPRGVNESANNAYTFTNGYSDTSFTTKKFY